ncbi:MAG TPA: thioredoxin domain-containing protein [Candidatus Eremiobacteraeota bacterium]|nr:thioredoxin domain-containing protein [Candidatus Eremiobacteraeota bacterium]
MTHKEPNRLIHEKSPYLLQHAYNPVDWYPWGEEAFLKAREEDKPIFLSIGYSTCHWCHVMEKESFEDFEVAELMNKIFVCIKVDREERPDIDGIYMTTCQVMTGGGGWPLTIIMTPDKKPFFAGTYIPKERFYGRIGLMDLIPRIQELWTNRKEDVLHTAHELTEALQRLEIKEPGEELNEDTLRTGYKQLLERFDWKYGGFSRSPKFPTPHNLFFLLRYWQKIDDVTAMEMIEKTLQFMRLGGIYDHIGFGFHRYSTDERWFLPHFEKMLYDQALVAMVYTEAFQATGKDEYGRTAREIFSYVLRDMTSQEGGFYSAEDADSEGEEGKFYLWSEEEILKILGREEGEIFIKVFNVEKGGNFREEATGEKMGRNILYLKKPLYEVALTLNISENSLRERIEKSREKLFKEREKRIHPHKDDKILTDWNGLMIAALSKGAQVFDDLVYLEAAKKCTGFILEKMYNRGRLLHRYRDGQSAITGNIDDYAFFIWGLLELYETDFDVEYLKKALELNETLIKYFWHEEEGAFYFTPHDGESLIIRQKEIYDGAIPSGNSVSMLNLLRLGRITGNLDYEQKVRYMGKTFSREVKQVPIAHTQLMVSLDFALSHSYEVVIAGDINSNDTKEILRTLRKHFLPAKIIIFRSNTVESPVTDIAEFTKNLTSIDNKATVYVCSNYTCNMPVTDKDKMLELFIL